MWAASFVGMTEREICWEERGDSDLAQSFKGLTAEHLLQSVMPTKEAAHIGWAID